MEAGDGWSHCKGQKCGLCRSSGLSSGRRECERKCVDPLACSLEGSPSLLGAVSVPSHSCHCEEQQGRDSFWYSQALHTPPLALESPQNFLTKYPLKGIATFQSHPQMACHEARVVLQLPGAKFPPRRPETEVIRSGRYKGTLFWVVPRSTIRSQPFGFNGLVSIQKDFSDPYKVAAQIKTRDWGFSEVVFNSHTCHLLSAMFKAVCCVLFQK